MTANELRDKAKLLSDEIAEFEAVPEEQLGEPELQRFAECVEELKPLAEQIRTAVAEERQKNLETVRSHAALGHVEAPAEATIVKTNESRSTTRKRDPYDFSDNAVRYGMAQIAASANGDAVLGHIGQAVASELRSRAHDAVEQAPEYVTDDTREAIARHIDADEGPLSAYMLQHGSPEYTQGFKHYMSTGEKRTAMSTTAGNGGYLIPFFLDPTIILTNTGSKNPFRAVSRIETINSNVWHGIASSGVTAEWLAEATEAADASPTVTQPTVTPAKAFAYVQASYEVIQDSNISSQIGMLVADAKDRLESAAFATGSGSNQPKGIVTTLQATTASRVSASTNGSFGGVDIFALVNSLPARYQDDCSWVAHWSIFNLVRQFAATSGSASSYFWTDLGPGIPPQLLGRPAYTSSSMQAAPLSTATASSDDVLVLGDFSNFLIVDRVGMELVFNPVVVGSSGRRPTGEAGYAAYWRVGSDCVNADAFRLLRV